MTGGSAAPVSPRWLLYQAEVFRFRRSYEDAKRLLSWERLVALSVLAQALIAFARTIGATSPLASLGAVYCATMATVSVAALVRGPLRRWRNERALHPLHTPENGALVEETKKLAQAMGIVEVRVSTSPKVALPEVTPGGDVILPTAAECAPRGLFHAAIAHELSHIAQGDVGLLRTVDDAAVSRWIGHLRIVNLVLLALGGLVLLSSGAALFQLAMTVFSESLYLRTRADARRCVQVTRQRAELTADLGAVLFSHADLSRLLKLLRPAGGEGKEGDDYPSVKERLAAVQGWRAHLAFLEAEAAAGRPPLPPT